MEDSVTVSGPGFRSVDAGRGTAWWSESWAMFMKNPAMWLVFSVITCVGFAVLGMIPLLGGLVAALGAPVIAAGWMLSARKLEGGGSLEVGDLFAGFDKDRLNPLIVLGALALAANAVVLLVMAVIGGGAVMGMVAGGMHRSVGGVMTGLGMGLLAVLVSLVLGFVIGMALWFASPLVVFRNVPPVDAMKASWSASMANIGPFLIYGLIWIVAAVIASIPIFLGWILLVPLTALGMYCSYQDIFERQ
jgi:uncharacterized membrane protein